jgi:hypothetical protein
MEKGDKTRKSVTETVAWSICKVVEDSLKWHDHEIPAEPVHLVEFQQDVGNYIDCLEETVVEMMLKWGLHGHRADQGLMPCANRHWVVSVWEYTFLLKTWDTVKDEDEPLIELLQLLSQQRQGAKRARGTGPATKVKCLPVDPALYDYIFIPIHLQRGLHWLLASIDVKTIKMQLYHCSQKYGSKWRGQIHSLLWVWFVASVRRLRAMGTAIQEEPQWGIDMCNVDLQDVEDLPGLQSPGVRSNLIESRLNKCNPDITRLLGGAVLSLLAVLNITVEGDRPNGQRQWHWSSDYAEAPQQRRGSDCGLLTVLCAIFKARGWNMQGLSSLDPRDMRGWFLRVLNSQGQWCGGLAWGVAEAGLSAAGAGPRRCPPPAAWRSAAVLLQ